jgi:hypothetical protein
VDWLVCGLALAVPESGPCCLSRRAAPCIHGLRRAPDTGGSPPSDTIRPRGTWQSGSARDGGVAVQRMSMIAIHYRGDVAVERHIHPWLPCLPLSRTIPSDCQSSLRAIGGIVRMRRRTVRGSSSIGGDLSWSRSTPAAEVDVTAGRFATCSKRVPRCLVRTPAPVAGGYADNHATSSALIPDRRHV